MTLVPRISPFKPASAEDFRRRCPQFADLVDWQEGRLWNLINSDPAYRLLASFSLRGLPAVASITQYLAPILAPIDGLVDSDPDAAKLADRIRRAIGSMIREVMECNGFQKTGNLRAVPPVPRRLFVRAEVFALADQPPPADDEVFNWDAHALVAGFEEIRSLSPQLGNQRLPTMYSPDRRWLYLTSMDLDVRTSCEADLRHMLKRIKEGHTAELRKTKPSPYRLHVHAVDFHEVCGLLYGLVGDHDEFVDPEALLAA